MFKDKDDYLLHVMAELDRMDCDEIETFVESASSLFKAKPATATNYPFLMRATSTPDRTVAAFIQQYFLPATLTPIWH